MVDAGIRAKDNCNLEFNEMRSKKTHRFIIFKIVDKKSVEIEHLGERSSSYEEFLKLLPRDQPRFIVYDFEFKSDDKRDIQKLAFIYWSPDESKVMEKMLYASTKESFKSGLVGIQRDIQAVDMGDLDVTAIRANIVKS